MVNKFTCKNFGKTTEVDTTKFVKNFILQLKKMGITVK